MPPKSRLASDEGLFELAGHAPAWIWAHTCPAPKCPCRTALVAATGEGREVLLERGAPIRRAWDRGEGYADAASEVDGLVVFALNIDTAAAYPIDGRERLDLDEHPGVRAIVERLDGEILDAIGHLWYRGKGRPDPEQEAARAREVLVAGWKPGDRLAWNALMGGVRRDLYALDDRVYEASETYCLARECDCGEVIVRFAASTPRGSPAPGDVTVRRPGGAVTLEPSKKGGVRLEWLWSAFQKRHPRYAERFERRSTIMKRLGTRVATKPRAGRP